MGFTLSAYLARLRLNASGLSPSLALLATILDAQSRQIPFENLDVVRGQLISMGKDDVFQKLVVDQRGGYCFEQNTLLQHALTEIGYDVSPLLCRVRWGKREDELTAFTHIALRVRIDGNFYLADVGFAGTNSLAPIRIADGVAQELVDGTFRTCEKGEDTLLEMQDREDPTKWRCLYLWKSQRWETLPDLEQCNWYSCTFPRARFTNQLFVSGFSIDKVTGTTSRIHLLNGELVKRTLETRELVSKTILSSDEEICEVIRSEFELPAEVGSGLGKYIA
mmetsp:Transcript_30100/g.80815  ORF Transcript_30100/g.80815 Transcript_30100/m.80815 type:complete len:279 (+) Transcript_30100:89-925(+)|eukprot:CAMPEP_0185558158 /NCGR_PEP_ID=MMETSP1381-20130426/51530_1 /TAXON_ID=298111 /ORGANISM="Pavlova sp., Strain CCMP459" /LENGTH=278 /DNA_ID=CAMNT_0028171679 /DNA_START=13 /DNA_END=849 /DNA_ORIENTATION=+